MAWTIEHGKHVLMLSLKVEKSAISFYWYCIDKNKINRSQNMIEQNALRLLKSWMDNGQCLIVIADRGFHRSVLQKNLQKANVDYIIRIPKTTHIQSNLHAGALENMKVKINRARDFKYCTLGENAKVPVRMVVKKIKLKKSKKKAETSTWYLATTLDYKKEEIVELYTRRMGIECAFKDLKTTLGWRFEKRISRPERVVRYLLILVITLILAWLTSLRKVARQILSKVSLAKAFGQIKYASFVQEGLWILQYLAPKYHAFHHRKPLWI
ncbi:MAG: transposase [Bdellovibrionales bacterium]|nr:transposase [Bdellovibrionales bacterium]